MTKSRGINAPYIRWTAEQISLLRQLYPDTPTHEIAKRLGRCQAGIYQKAVELGLRKSAAYLASPYGGRIRPGSHVGGATRFRKGNVRLKARLVIEIVPVDEVLANG